MTNRTEAESFTLEAAMQYGFETTNDDADMYACSDAQLLAFAKACAAKGRAEAVAEMERVAAYSTDQEKGALGVVIFKMSERNRLVDAELAPIRDAEEANEAADNGRNTSGNSADLTAMRTSYLCAGGISLTCEDCPKCGASMDEPCAFAAAETEPAS